MIVRNGYIKRDGKHNKLLSKKTKIILLVSIIFVAILLGGFLIFYYNYHIYDSKIIEPTCTENGYTEYTCRYCHKIVRKNYTAASGHNFGEIKTTKKASETSFGTQIKTCATCGEKVVYNLEPTSKIKKVYLNGDVYGTNDARVSYCSASYSYNGEKTDKKAIINYLDSSHAKYVKHDIEIEFYNDDNYSEKSKLSLIKGVSSSKWRLYGDYYDYYNARNYAATQLFKNLRQMDSTNNSMLKKTYGTAKSEPVLVFVNNSFAGVYSIVQDIDKEMFDMNDSECQAIVSSTAFNDCTKFNKEIEDKTSGWEIAYSYNEESDWVYNSLNGLISFVKNSDDKEFKKNLSNYLDVNAMIDYMLTVYMSGSGANTVQNMVLGTYDGTVWIPSVYDMNCSFGLDSKGKLSNLEDSLIPNKSGETIYSDTSSLLFQRMLENFYDEIKTRYKSLENTQLAASNIISLMNERLDEVNDSIYDADANLYKAVDSDFDITQQITDFIATRKNGFSVFFN